MTDRDIHTTVGAPEDVPPMTSDEAAEIVEQDQALRDAGGNDEEDPAAADDRP